MQELNLEFLNSWKNLNELEIKGIETLKRGIEVIFENISKNEIISIYLKGSFLRREMNSKSDIDVVIIVKEESTLKKINQLQKNYGNSKELNFGFSGYTINELKTGKLIKRNNNPRSGTPRFVRLLSTYQLIYGEKLDVNNFFQKTEKQLFESLISAFENIFLPKYELDEIDFPMIIKQSLWLFELEVAINNKNYQFTTWNNLTNYLNENHLINEALKFRNIKKPEKKKKEEYILKLKKHLEKLKLINIFTKIRDIPYYLPQTINDKDFRCWGKSRLLFEKLKELTYNVRFRICEFKWDEQRIPNQITKLAPKENDLHLFIEIFLENNWIILDPSNDSELPSYNNWDSKSNTQIAVKYTEIFSPKESLKLEQKERENYSKEFKSYIEFNKEMNKFFKKLRKKSNSRH